MNSFGATNRIVVVVVWKSLATRHLHQWSNIYSFHTTWAPFESMWLCVCVCARSIKVFWKFVFFFLLFLCGKRDWIYSQIQYPRSNYLESFHLCAHSTQKTKFMYACRTLSMKYHDRYPMCSNLSHRIPYRTERNTNIKVLLVAHRVIVKENRICRTAFKQHECEPYKCAYSPLYLIKLTFDQFLLLNFHGTKLKFRFLVHCVKCTFANCKLTQCTYTLIWLWLLSTKRGW